MLVKKTRDSPSLTTLNSMTWVCGAAKFTPKQVQQEEEEGGTGCGYAIELLNADGLVIR